MIVLIWNAVPTTNGVVADVSSGAVVHQPELDLQIASSTR